MCTHIPYTIHFCQLLDEDLLVLNFYLFRVSRCMDYYNENFKKPSFLHSIVISSTDLRHARHRWIIPFSTALRQVFSHFCIGKIRHE